MEIVKSKRIFRKLLTPNGVFLIFVCIGMALFMGAVPQHLDDCWYNYPSYEWLKAHGYTELGNGVDILSDGISWESVAETWRLHYYYDNVRLADVVLPVMLYFPVWFNTCLMVLCFGYSVVGMCRLAGADPWRSPLMPVMVCLLSWILPWKESLTVLAYQLNYIAATAVTVFVLQYIRGHNGRRNVMAVTGSFLTGLLAGVWHEGFALPVGSALFVLWLAFPAYRSRVVFTTVVGMAIGFVLIMSSPGIRDRASQAMGVRDIWAVRALLENVFIFPVAVIFTLCATFRTGWRRLLSSPLLVFLAVSGSVSLILSLMSTQTARSAWWAYVAGIWMIIMVSRMGWGRFWHRYSRRNVAAGVASIALTLLYWGYASVYAVRIHEENKRLMAEWRQRPGQTRWSRLVERRDFPMPCAMLYFVTWMNDVYAYPLSYDSFVRTGDYKACFGYGSLWGVVPEALRYVTPESGEAVPGGSGIRVKDGHLFMLEDDRLTSELKEHDISMSKRILRIDFGKGYVNVGTQQLSFRSEADGRRYSFFAPETAWYVTFFKKIKAISDHKYVSKEINGTFWTVELSLTAYKDKYKF